MITLKKWNFPNIFEIDLELERYKWTLIESELEEENENLKVGMTKMEKTISECDREIDELLDLIQFLTNENRILKVLPSRNQNFLAKDIIVEIIQTFFSVRTWSREE